MVTSRDDMDSDSIQASESLQETPSPAESALEAPHHDQLAIESAVALDQLIQSESPAADQGELAQQPSTEQPEPMESVQPSASGLHSGGVAHSTAGSEVDVPHNEHSSQGVTASSPEADAGLEGASSQQPELEPPEAVPETLSRRSTGLVPDAAPSPEAAVPDSDQSAYPAQEVEQLHSRPSQDSDQQPSSLTDDAPLAVDAASNYTGFPAEQQAARQQAQDASSSDRQHQEADIQVEASHFSLIQPEASSTSQTSTGAPRRAAKFVSKRIGQPHSRSLSLPHSRPSLQATNPPNQSPFRSCAGPQLVEQAACRAVNPTAQLLPHGNSDGPPALKTKGPPPLCGCHTDWRGLGPQAADCRHRLQRADHQLGLLGG